MMFFAFTASWASDDGGRGHSGSAQVQDLLGVPELREARSVEGAGHAGLAVGRGGVASGRLSGEHVQHAQQLHTPSQRLASSREVPFSPRPAPRATPFPLLSSFAALDHVLCFAADSPTTLPEMYLCYRAMIPRSYAATADTVIRPRVPERGAARVLTVL